MAIRGKASSFLRTAVLVLAVVFAAKEACRAWWPSDLGYPGSGGYVPWLSDLERLPYFSLHPPVYYSRPVPRTYGYTPFASLPDLTIFQSVQTQPMTVPNPYVASSAPAAVGTSVGPAPLIVRNPFVDRPGKGKGPKKRQDGK